MCIKRMVLHVFDKVRKAVALCVEVGGVYLVNIARENNLGMLARTGDDGFYFVRGEVLRLVDDEENIGQRAATDK